MILTLEVIKEYNEKIMEDIYYLLDEFENESIQENSVTNLLDDAMQKISNFFNNCSNTSADLIKSDTKLANYEICHINFQNSIDTKIIQICENIYNNEQNEIHRFNDMNIFLSYCIDFTENLLKLIEKLMCLIYENSNYYLKNNLNKDLNKIKKEFIENCRSIGYFYIETNYSQIADLHKLFDNYQKTSFFSENDFDNSDSIYSNVQLTWTKIKINLVSYKEDKYKQFENMSYLKKKRITSWNPISIISNMFYTNDILDKNVKPLMIENKIKNPEYCNTKLISC